MIAIVALLAMPSVGALLRWSVLAILVALLPFAPLLADRTAAAAPLAAQVAEYVGSTMQASNLLDTGPLLWAMLARGPRIVADAFVAMTSRGYPSPRSSRCSRSSWRRWPDSCSPPGASRCPSRRHCSRPLPSPR